MNKGLLPTIICLFCAMVATAQSGPIKKRVKPAGERPKIGLVLSGGGAKGLAHIGVLKAIDRAGLKIDYITGTSMGAIVAAMYASGYSAEQIEEIALNTDWMKLINSRPMLRDISIEDKDEFDNYTITLPMKGFSPQLNTGFFVPYEVLLKMKEIFYPVYKVNDFNKLDIPFKCIAADLANGDAVVLDHGDLAFATRSSMAIPGVFSAMDYRGTKLVDGGIVRNFPVRDVIDMGADYVIGVNLFSGLSHTDELGSMVDVMLQITNFRDAKDLEEEKSVCDMVIEPDVSAYSSASFDASETILAIGDSTGRDFEPLFQQLADSIYSQYGVRMTNPNRLKSYDSQVRLSGFHFSGLNTTTESLLRHALNLHEGQLYSPSDFTAAVKSAMSTGYYKNVSYDLIPIDNNSNLAIFKCKVEENPRAALKIGLSYNSFTNASIILDYQYKGLFKDQSITDFKVAVSKDFRFRLNNRFLFGIKNNYYFDSKYEHSLFYVPRFNDKSVKENVYKYIHNDIALSVGHAFNPKGDLSFTIGWEDFRVKPDAYRPDDYRGHIRDFYATIRRRINTLDRKFLPTSGLKFDAEAYCALHPFNRLKTYARESVAEPIDDVEEKVVSRISANLQLNQPVSKRLTVSETIAATVGYGGKAFVYKTAIGGCDAFLPSHFSFYGLVTAHRFESTAAMGRVSLQYNLIDNLYLLAHANAAMTFKSIDYYVDKDLPFKPEEYLRGIGASVAYNLFNVLPMDFTLMYSKDDKFNVSVNIGYFF